MTTPARKLLAATWMIGSGPEPDPVAMLFGGYTPGSWPGDDPPYNELIFPSGTLLPAKSTRRVFAIIGARPGLVGSSPGAAAVASATIGGIPATIYGARSDTLNTMAIATAIVPTGTSFQTNVTFSGPAPIVPGICAWYSATDLVDSSPTAIADPTNATSPANQIEAPLAVQPGGIAIAAAYTSLVASGSPIWEANPATGFAYEGSYLESTGRRMYAASHFPTTLSHTAIRFRAFESFPTAMRGISWR